jgi:acyl-CoA synthetase (NDP forming)
VVIFKNITNSFDQKTKYGEVVMNKNNNIRYLLRPKSVALLGCSEHNLAGSVLENLLRNEFPGNIYPVHPRNSSVFGVKCYAKIADIPGEIDVCVVALRSELVLNSIEEMKEKGIRAAVILASGFSEVGPEGKKLEREVARKLNEYGIVACGPNCLGLINVHDKATLYSAATDLSNMKGNIGVVSHSGSVCIALSSASINAGFSYLVSCGNETNLTVADYFRAMVEDVNTEIIVGFLETIRDPHGLQEVAKLAVKKNKPIIILKVGKSEIAQITATAHSGALSSPTDVTDAFFEQNCILQANSFDEVVVACELLLRLKNLPVQNDVYKIGMTAISGGQLGFCCDAAFEKDVTFGSISEDTIERIRNTLPSFATAKNPLDVTTALFETDQYKECLRALAMDADIGLIAICQDAEAGMFHKEIELYKKIVLAIAEVSNEIEKPLVVFSPFSSGLVQEFYDILATADVPLVQGAHECMHAINLYFDWMRFRKKCLCSSDLPDTAKRVDFTFGDSTSLSERESKSLLKMYGIEIPEDILVMNEDEAVKAANSIGYPVVLKVDSPDILHKTEAKILKLNVNSAEEVRKGYSEILENARRYNSSARINGVSVQEMIPKGVEILLGGKVDSQFGATVMVGTGGIFVDVFKDYALRLAPINLETAYQMIDSLKGSALLRGFRGAKKSDVNALAKALVQVGRIMCDHSDRIAELDINPVIVLEEGRGLKAVDALVVLKKQRG